MLDLQGLATRQITVQSAHCSRHGAELAAAERRSRLRRDKIPDVTVSPSDHLPFRPKPDHRNEALTPRPAVISV